jgi:hypothetical protein
MSTSVPASQNTLVFLPDNNVLTVTTDSASTARIGRLADTPASPDIPSSFAGLAASTSLSFGPFTAQSRWLLDLVVGPGVTYTIAPNVARLAVIGTSTDIVHIFASGTPTDGITGAGVAARGSHYTDTNAGKLYINSGTGTKASPTWKIVTSA